MHLKHPLQLPCGTTLPNRIAKSAMSENMSTKKQEPTPDLIRAYQTWAKGGAGLIVTGNIMIDHRALGEPRNVVVEDKRDFKLLQDWANTVKGTGAHLWAQINHPGRQAMEEINSTLYAPSAVPLVPIGRKNPSKKIPKALTKVEIKNIIERFGNTALILKEAGFTGVQIHGAHGYLVSQFLSPYTNVREDKWGGSIENRTRFVIEVYRNIREKTGKNFPIGIKMNSADFQKGGFSEEESMEVIKMLSAEGFDLIEISGGTYEAPAMMGKRKDSTKKREAYFIDYIEKARKITDVPLMLTGGFRTTAAMNEAIESGALDVVGLARPFTIYPDLPNQIFDEGATAFPVDYKRTGVKMLDAGLSLVWYEHQIKILGRGEKPDPNLSGWTAMLHFIKLILGKRFGWG